MKSNRLGLGLIAAMATTLVAATPLRNALTFEPSSRIWVSGKSSVKDFRCQAKTIDANLSAPSAETADLSIAKLVSVAEISIASAALDCGNGTMNDHMRKALKTDQFKTIVFKMSSYEVVGEEIMVNGTLTMAGKDLRVELKGKVTEQGGVIRSTATKEIDMTQWGVKPPSLMMGTMKVKPIATIGYDISIRR